MSENKSNKQKTLEFRQLLIDLVNGLKDFPKPLKMLAASAVKAIDENKIDEILDGTMDFLSSAYIRVEAIKESNVIEFPKTGTEDVH